MLVELSRLQTLIIQSFAQLPETLNKSHGQESRFQARLDRLEANDVVRRGSPALIHFNLVGSSDRRNPF